MFLRLEYCIVSPSFPSYRPGAPWQLLEPPLVACSTWPPGDFLPIAQRLSSTQLHLEHLNSIPALYQHTVLTMASVASVTLLSEAEFGCGMRTPSSFSQYFLFFMLTTSKNTLPLNSRMLEALPVSSRTRFSRLTILWLHNPFRQKWSQSTLRARAPIVF